MIGSFPSEAELSDAIAVAAEIAVKALFAPHPGHYYYLSLITTGEAHPPVLAAWSHEALDEAVEGKLDQKKARRKLEWSYADSPFCCFGEEFFAGVNELFRLRPDINDLEGDASQNEYDLRLRAMESAIAKLDQQGLFGRGADRLKIVVNVEVMPPDFTNTLRAMRLNPPKATCEWLAEAAEPVP